MENKEENFISLVAYVHNDRSYIKKFYQEIDRTLRKKFKNYEIIFIDDGSTDDSIQQLKSLTPHDDPGTLSIVTMSYFQGREKSLAAGNDLALGDFVFEFDSVVMDYDPNIIYKMYKKALDNNDIVVATEENQEAFMSKIFYEIFNHYADIQYSIGTERMRLLSRRAINRVKMLNKHTIYSKATYANTGLNRVELTYKPNTKINRKLLGKNKGRFSLALTTLILFTNFFYKLALFLSILMMIITASVAIYTITLYLTGNVVTGWPTIMLFLSFGFFSIFIFFTIVIKYMDVLVRLNFSNQDYLVKDVDKFR